MSLDDLLEDIEIDSNMVIPGSFSDKELVQEAKRQWEQEDMDSEEEEEFLPEEVTAALKVVRKFAQKKLHRKWCYVIKKNWKANYCYQNEKSEADFHNIFYFIISELINFCLFFI